MKQNLKAIEKKKLRKMKLDRIARNKYVYFMAIPVMLWYLIFSYIPMYGVTLAFRKFTPGGLMSYIFGGNWVGFKYFEQIMTDPLFYRALKNTLIISAMKLSIEFPLVIVLVLLLNEIKFKIFKRVTQTIMYLPHFLSWVIIATIMTQMFSVDGGIITNVIAVFNGGEKINYLTQPDKFRWILVAATCFKNMGWDTIIYLSALAGIPAELYEAADVDGASRFRKVISITLPSLLPTIVTMLLIKISNMIAGDFDQIYNLYNSSVYDVADIIETYLFRVGVTSGKFSMATAMGLFKSVISLMMLAGANFISRKITGNGIW